MKVKSIKANQTEIHLSNGNVVFVSYETPVAFFESGKGVVKTGTKWSQTTTKHISEFCHRHGLTLRGERPQEYFDTLLTDIES